MVEQKQAYKILNFRTHEVCYLKFYKLDIADFESQ